MNKLRTFLSLNINNNLREKISQFQDEIKKILFECNTKWENPEKFHLTMRFLGDTEEDKIGKLIKDLNDIRFNFNILHFVSDSIDFFRINESQM